MREDYQQRADAATARLRVLDRRGSWIAHGRSATFLGAAALVALELLKRLSPASLVGAVALGLGYAGLALWHERVLQAEREARLFQELNRRELARLEGGWHSFPEDGQRFWKPEHLYAADLDLFGKGSLFQLLNRAATRAGEQVLAGWLLSPAPTAELPARQEAVRELASRLDLRQRLWVSLKLARADRADPEGAYRWAEGAPQLRRVAWARRLPYVLPPLTLALLLLGLWGPLPQAAVWVGLGLQLGAVALTRGAMGESFAVLGAGEQGWVRLENSFQVLEPEGFRSPRLAALVAGWARGPQAPSALLRRLGRLYAWAELRRNQLHPLINWLLLWDLFFLFRIEDWRRLHGARIRPWFEALAELEALSCLAGHHFDRPQDPFPQLVQAPQLRAEGLGHPLLLTPVCNDVALTGPGQALIITGSNMSGKTTLLRALGANVVLALAGAPVCAGSLTLGRLQVATSMRLADSLEQGVSYFQAEVRRLKRLLDTAQAHPQGCLVLLDEILMGTNTAERQWASREVVRLLLDQGALAAIATHDLTLASLAQERPAAVRNVHFLDLVENGRMTFDYRLREGVVTATNALRVLRDAGIPVSEAPPRSAGGTG